MINFFGINSDLTPLSFDTKTLIEDNVFQYNFKNNHNAKKWFAFNSFRKISPLTDGSLIKTNLKIDSSLIINEPAPYYTLKKKACSIKFAFLMENKFSEKEYLSLFQDGEKEIDKQKEIYSISNDSLNSLFKEDYNIQDVLKKRYNKLIKTFETINLHPAYYSFFPLSISNKNAFFQEMKKKNIFLPNFWPKSSQNNNLYTNLVVIPLFYNYSDSEFNYILKQISIFLEHDK